jgi:hypothetical protein
MLLSASWACNQILRVRPFTLNLCVLRVVNKRYSGLFTVRWCLYYFPLKQNMALQIMYTDFWLLKQADNMYAKPKNSIASHEKMIKYSKHSFIFTSACVISTCPISACCSLLGCYYKWSKNIEKIAQSSFSKYVFLCYYYKSKSLCFMEQFRPLFLLFS